MNAAGLFASAAINIGLSLFILILFSILRKQRSNAGIYFPRRLSRRQRFPFDQAFTVNRFIPSVSWISKAIRVTEDEVLELGGLDGLVLVRLFKFGIKFFSVCSILGLVVLLPVNSTAPNGSSKSSNSMDSYSISHISGGSDRLWVHFSCLWFISCYGLYLLYKEYDDILAKRIQQMQNNRHHPNQFTVLVREIPLCKEHLAYGCCVDHFFAKHHSYAYCSYQILYNSKDLENVLKEAKHVSGKLEGYKCKALNKKQKKEPSLSEMLGLEAKITFYQEKLEGLYSRIHQIQKENRTKQKELPVAFVTFKTRWGAALVAQSQQHPNPLTWITDMAPEPRDVLWMNLAIPYRHVPLYKISIYVSVTLLTIFFAIPVTAIQGIAKIERLKKWFPPVMAIYIIPGLGPVITGYLPSAILNGFIYLIPFAMLALAKLAGYESRSKHEIRVCNMVFYFLVGNVFFLSLLSGSLLDQIGESFSHPKHIPTHLARAVSAQADFFMTYILTNGLSGFSLEILQLALFTWDAIRSRTLGRGEGEKVYLNSFPYCRIIPLVSLSILIGMAYAVVAPLLLPFIIVYFFLGYVVFLNQIEDVYEPAYETCGQYWPYIHHYIVLAILLMQIIMIGLFGMKAKPAASFAAIPLLLLTIAFNEYCKIRFLPSFYHYPIQSAMNNDELDEKNGVKDAYENALNVYSPPCWKAINLSKDESNSSDIEPLLSSSQARIGRLFGLHFFLSHRLSCKRRRKLIGKLYTFVPVWGRRKENIYRPS